MLFLVIGLRAVERDIGHHAEASGSLVVALGEDGIVKVSAPGDKGLEGFLIDNDDGIRGAIELDDGLRPFFTDERGIAAGNDIAVSIDHADDAVGGLLHLNDHTLKNATGHSTPSLNLLFTQTTIDIILRFQQERKVFLTFYLKTTIFFCGIFIVFRH